MADETEDLGDLTSPAARNIAAARQGLMAQKDAAHAAVGAVDKAEQGAMGNLRMRNAANAVAARSRGGGGSLAGARQNDLQRGVAEGALTGDFALKRAGATQDAAKADTDFATESQKLDTAAEKQGQVEQTTYDAMMGEWQAFADEQTFYVDDDDRKTVADNLRAKYGNSGDPAVKKALDRAIADIYGQKGTGDAGGVVDVDSDWSSLSWL